MCQPTRFSYQSAALSYCTAQLADHPANQRAHTGSHPPHEPAHKGEYCSSPLWMHSFCVQYQAVVVGIISGQRRDSSFLLQSSCSPTIPPWLKSPGEVTGEG
jgi:hypothetical protein